MPVLGVVTGHTTVRSKEQRTNLVRLPRMIGVGLHLVHLPGPVEEAKFYFPGDPLRAFLDKKLSSPALLARTQVFIDDTPVPYGAIRTETANGSH